MTQKTLVIRASGGLSNRLQAVAAGVGYCLLTGRALCVDWRDGMYSDDFSNVFPHWFTLRDILTASCESVCGHDTPYPPFWQEWLREAILVEYLIPDNEHLNPENVARSSIDFTDLHLPQDVVVGWGWDLTPAQRLAPLLRQQIPRFATDTDDTIVRRLFAEHVIPADDLTAEAEAFASRHFAPRMVGIHIRYTDLQSPLENMLHKLAAVATQGSGIFLTTDNQQVERMVRRLFPGTVYREKIYQGPDTPLHCHIPGISNVQKGREALLDMLLLARCQDIIHFERSSFARIPIFLSGIALDHVHAVR